jgi:histidinol-phosphate/aromatic aminotransferase/cobyric acid decarboxylase-like protein
LVNLKGDDPQLAGQVRRWLLERSSIEVKDVSAKFTDNAPRLRIAVRTMAENDQLVEALRELSREDLSAQ